MKQDTEFFKKRRKYIKQLKDRRRAYEKLVGDIQHDLEVEFRDLRRSFAAQLAMEKNKPDPDPVVCARCKKYYQTIREITGNPNESKPHKSSPKRLVKR
jgi:hypothetical protein